ncbi:MAG: hypothetical protein IKZ87_08945 [Actinomycetaceae bacterium]|nr:hypothetical protein [Actinomycetaceae bacterium]
MSKNVKRIAAAPFRLFGAMMGMKQLEQGNIYIKDMARALRNPSCPVCEKGVMVKTAGNDNMWLCSNDECLHNFSAADMEEAHRIVQQKTKEKGLTLYESLTPEDKDTLLKARRFQSRFFFTLALLSFIGCLYMVASGSSIAVAAAWLAVTSAFLTNGIKESYRYWQVQTGTLFAPGNPFKEWFRTGRWFV